MSSGCVQGIDIGKSKLTPNPRDEIATDGRAERSPTAGHQAFRRPATRLNLLVDRAVEHLPQHTISEHDVWRWLDDSIAVYSGFVKDQAALARVKTGTRWELSDDPPPDANIWSGECTFNGGEAPVAICYSQTLASRLPQSAFDLAWQGAMDHFVGHLYPFHQGAEDPSDYDEQVACRYQHLAAQRRGIGDLRFRLIARLIPPVYKLHKRIPLKSYDRVR